MKKLALSLLLVLSCFIVPTALAEKLETVASLEKEITATADQDNMENIEEFETTDTIGSIESVEDVGTTNSTIIQPVQQQVETFSPQGPFIKDNRYIRITKENYGVYLNFQWKEKNNTTNLDIYGKVFQVRGYYNHSNGYKYLSLYENNGNWLGYLNEHATKATNPQGPYWHEGSYVQINKKNYELWKNFNWDKKGISNDIYNKTLYARGKYEHFNGNIYYSLFDKDDNWYGYINSKATKEVSRQGEYISDGSYVEITNKNYSVYNNFNWDVRTYSYELYDNLYQARGRYEHFNGLTYYSIYDNNGKWAGYINKNATKVTPPQGRVKSDGRQGFITSKNYTIWQNFNWVKKSTTSKIYGKEYNIRNRYLHYNGSTYYSLFDQRNNWIGYVNSDAVKVAEYKKYPRITMIDEIDQTYPPYESSVYSGKLGYGNFTFPTSKDAEEYFYTLDYAKADIVQVRFKKNKELRYTLFIIE